MMSDLNKMTITELRAIEEKRPEGAFNSFIIVPTNRKHDSGYGCMKFVLLNKGEIVGCLGGYSDVIHLNGIGGYGKDFKRGLHYGVIGVVDWSMDLLAKSKCVRVFCSKELETTDWPVLSDFEVFAKDR